MYLPRWRDQLGPKWNLPAKFGVDWTILKGRSGADGGRTLQIRNLHLLKRKVTNFEGGCKFFFLYDHKGVLFKNE